VITTGSRRVSVGVVACVISILACRDGPAAYTVVEFDPAGGALQQITFSPGHDVNPTWSAGSDSVYYTATHAIDYPAHPLTMLRIARSGGVQQRLAPHAQNVVQSALALPVLSPDRARVAYVEMAVTIGTVPAAVCDTGQVGITRICMNSEPFLLPGVVRVRLVGATGSANGDASVPLPLRGVDPRRAEDRTSCIGTECKDRVLIYQQTDFPFQLAYRNRGEMVFRATWSPDGRRVAFSDGLQLLLWDISTTAAAAIPNSTDAVSPAWSPTRDRIAFTRIARIDSARTTCRCREPETPLDTFFPDTHVRWTYTTGTPTITLIDANGSNSMVVGAGEDAAWSPDGNTLYYRTRDGIYRVAPTGGTPVLIAQTQGARSPAVSPDGKWLAFTKGTDTDQNVWVLRMNAQ
jgi:Tol biopolymer transport system component